MTFQTGSIVTRDDVVSYFETNVKEVVTLNSYYYTRIPTFSGDAGTVNAIPQADLDTIDSISSLSLSDGMIYGSTVYDAMIALVKNYTRVRNFTSYYQYQSDDGYSTQSTVTGKAIFQTTLPTVASNYSRSKDGSLLVDPSVSDNLSGNIGTVSRVQTLVSNLVSAWESARNDSIVYYYYCCHSSCHSSCHGNRGRR